LFISKVGDVPTPWSAFSFVTGLNVQNSIRSCNSDDVSNAPTAIPLDEIIRSRFYPALAEGINIFLAESSGEGIVIQSGI
jgi:hypothetical protein